jgi:hypothetical protein
MTEEQELQQAFSHLLLVGNLLRSPVREAGQKKIADLLEMIGFSITNSEYIIVDKSRVGDSTITVVRYSIECQEKNGGIEKPFIIDGGLALEEDDYGNLNISIFTKSNFFLNSYASFHTEGFPIDREVPPASHPSPSFCLDSK